MTEENQLNFGGGRADDYPWISIHCLCGTTYRSKRVRCPLCPRCGHRWDMLPAAHNPDGTLTPVPKTREYRYVPTVGDDPSPVE